MWRYDRELALQKKCIELYWIGQTSARIFILRERRSSNGPAADCESVSCRSQFNECERDENETHRKRVGELELSKARFPCRPDELETFFNFSSLARGSTLQGFRFS